MADPVFDHDACLAAIATGDQHAFEALYYHESPHMMALAKKMLGRKHEAEQLLRDTFVLIWKHAESYDATLSPARPWLYSILRDRALRILRHPARVQASDKNFTDTFIPSVNGDPLQEALNQAFRQLPAEQRRPLLMAYYHGHTHRQIAGLLGSSAHHIQQQIRNALVQIHRACP